MKNLILAVLATLALGCTHPMVKSHPEQDKPEVQIDLAPEIKMFLGWANTEFPKIQKQLGVTGAPRIVFYTSLGQSIEKNGNFYSILGKYSYMDKTIHMYWRFYYRNSFFQTTQGLSDLKYTFYHEILHWYDHITGKPRAPADHNELFDKRMRALGWIK
jgi:hypothetical protein